MSRIQRHQPAHGIEHVNRACTNRFEVAHRIRQDDGNAFINCELPHSRCERSGIRLSALHCAVHIACRRPRLATAV